MTVLKYIIILILSILFLISCRQFEDIRIDRFKYFNKYNHEMNDGRFSFGVYRNWYNDSDGPNGPRSSKTFKFDVGYVTMTGFPLRLEYENDGGFDKIEDFLNIDMNDGDRYRTAAFSVSCVNFSAKVNLYSGEYITDDNGVLVTEDINGQNYYIEKSTPRFGGLSISFYGETFGVTRENIRHYFQNLKVHKPAKIPFFRKIDIPDRYYKPFNYNRMNTLW